MPDPTPEWILARRRIVGGRLRAVRERADLTQEKLGERAGVDRLSINRIEQGRATPKLDTLIRLADALRVPLAELVGDV